MDFGSRSELEHLAGQLQDTLKQWMGSPFSEFHPAECWSPAVNAYQLPDRLEICFDLAGVDKDSIDVRAEPGRLRVRGLRQAPEPDRGDGEAMRILSMEIDYGPFARTVQLPTAVEVEHITARQVNGLLWIRLPLRTTG